MLDWIEAVLPGRVPSMPRSEPVQSLKRLPKPLFDGFVASTLDSALVSCGRFVRALLKVVSSRRRDPSFCTWTPIELSVEKVDEALVDCEIIECSWFWMLVTVLSPCSGAAVCVVGS